MEFKKGTLALAISVLCIAVTMGFIMTQEEKPQEPEDYVTIAILAKDKAHTLPLYLSCIEKQTWPANKSYLYIRTNNNNDDTVNILREWVEKVSDKYAGVYFDDTDVQEQVQNYKQHEWNSVRFKVLGKIRQDSIDNAKKNNSHYFVADCDNFIHPATIEKLMGTNLPIVAPLLKVAEPSMYSNYHAAIDQNGYYADSPYYHDILNRKIQGLIELPVVHCSYFIRQDVLDKISYDDDSFRYEYVIFSDSARKNNIPQYIDNREVYGRLTFAENADEFAKEPWIFEFQTPDEQVKTAFSAIYQNGVWGKNKDGTGCSGTGSTAENTELYRIYLETFLETHQIKSVVDIGCGDWEFSHLINWNGIKYTGYDVVKNVIENNANKYSKPSIKFINENFLTADLPKADLLICKDVFQHLSNEEVMAFLPQLKKFKYCVITNDFNPAMANNLNTRIGGYRPLDLTKPPFNLSGEKALQYSAGGCTKQIFYVENSDSKVEKSILTAQK